MVTVSLFSAALLPLSGCEILDALFNQEFELPVELESPPAEIDATTPVEETEQTMCDDADSPDCAVVKALDLTDDTMVSDPPKIPDEFPNEVTVTDPVTMTEDTINVETWMNESGLTDEIELAQVIPVDLTSQVDVDSPEAIQDVTFENLALNYISNTLTFDTVDLDLYISEDSYEATDDPEALIEDGSVIKVGTIEAMPAGTDGDAAIVFAEGGSDAFNEALKNLSFTAVIALPPETAFQLKEGSTPEMRLKPKGVAEVSIKATIAYTVSAAQVAEQVDSAAGDAAE
jgi:hypothetical protein